MDSLIGALLRLPSRDGLMNPYASATGPAAADHEDEVGEEADALRLRNLRTFLGNVLQEPRRVLLVGEAPGYQGCRYSGLAFTSERELAAGWTELRGTELLPAARFGRRPLNREPSGQAVWEAISRKRMGIVPWNSVPLHPHTPGKARSNRTPSREEVALGRESLEAMIALVEPEAILPIGNTAAAALRLLGMECDPIRHPAYGGKPHFLRGLEERGVIGPSLAASQQSLF